MYLGACRGPKEGGGGEAVACMYYIWQCTLRRVGDGERGGGEGKLWLVCIIYGNVHCGV